MNNVNVNNGLFLFYTNAGSLINKMDELKMGISRYKPDIICVTETHFSPGV